MMTVVLGRTLNGLTSTKGSKGNSGETLSAGTDGDGSGDSRRLATRDTKGDGVHGASPIDDLHTTLIILHMPIVQKTNHLRGYPKPSTPGIEHPVPKAP